MRIGDRSLPDCEESPCDCYFEGSDDLAMVRMAWGNTFDRICPMPAIT